jgi:hypothetical protein
VLVAMTVCGCGNNVPPGGADNAAERAVLQSAIAHGKGGAIPGIRAIAGGQQEARH